MTWTGVGFVQSSWRQALSLEHMQNAAKVGPYSLGPSSTVMGHSGGWRQDRGPRIWIRMVEVSGKWTEKAQRWASEDWLLCKRGPGPTPCVLCLPNRQFLRSPGRILSQQRYRWDSYNSGCKSKH